MSERMETLNETRPPATPQEIWDILREVSASQKETDRQMQETDRLLMRLDRENDRLLCKTEDLFISPWEKLVDALAAGVLVRLLRKRGIEARRTFCNHEGEYRGRHWWFNMAALSAEELVVVEVKTTLRMRHVDHFLGRLRDYHLLMPDFTGSRRVYGAVAYWKAYQASARYADARGLYVIRATGGQARITNSETFRPRTFNRPSSLRPLNLPGRRTARCTGRRGSDSQTQEIIDAYRDLLDEEVGQ